MAAIDDEIRTLEGLVGDSERDPDGRGFVTLADVLRRAGRPEQARELLRAGIVQHPDFVSALVALAQVHDDLRELRASELAWRRVIELDPEHRFAHESLERVQVQLAEESAGVHEVEEPGELDVAAAALPADTLATTVQDVVEGEIAEDTAQDEFIERVLGEVPRRPAVPRVSRPVVTRTLAETYARQGLLDAAVDVYRTLAEAQPDNREIIERLAQLEAELGGAPPAPAMEPESSPASPTIADYFSNLLSSDHEERETQ